MYIYITQENNTFPYTYTIKIKIDVINGLRE